MQKKPNKTNNRKLKEEFYIMDNFKAIFLVGGPGSGKDFIINSALKEHKLVELPLDRIYTAITKQVNIEELASFPSIVVNGNADNQESVLLTKSILEAMGYDTSMIYVYTSDESSKERNDSRIARGVKTFSEETRKKKYDICNENMHKFFEEFDTFLLYDNSHDYNLVSEERKEEIAGWLAELKISVNNFISSFPKNESALRWMSERVLEVGTDSTAQFARNLTPGQNGKRVRTYAQADRQTGTATANFNSPTRTTVEQKQIRKKQTPPPSVNGETRNMAVGSQGVASVPMTEVRTKINKKRLQKYPEAGLSTSFGSVTNFGNPDAGVGLIGYKAE